MSGQPLTAERRTARGHRHIEAFCLMWYACKCGHQERIWNSRDGVTPFCTRCPSCGSPNDLGSLRHVRWREDAYAPDHKPTFGQRVWVDMTRAAAEEYARGRIAAAREAGHEIAADYDVEGLVRNIMGLDHGGAAPDMVVTGYAAALKGGALQ